MLTSLLALAIAGSYLFSIYFLQPDAIRKADRNSPTVIKYRFKRVTILCLLLLVAIPTYLSWGTTYTFGSVFTSFGLIPSLHDVVLVIYCLMCVCILYSGPIADYCYDELARYGIGALIDDFITNFTTYTGVRDHIFAPFTEELIYRALVIQTLKHGPSPPSRNVIQYGTPLYFGVAHVHHAWELKKRGIETPVVVFNVFFQTTYTTLFGMLATYLYEKYGTLWCPVVVHAACNLMSFPAMTVDGSTTFQTTYYVLLVVGLVGFMKVV